MEKKEFEKQAGLLLRNLAKNKYIIGRTKLLLEDVDAQMLLIVDNCFRHAERRRKSQ